LVGSGDAAAPVQFLPSRVRACSWAFSSVPFLSGLTEEIMILWEWPHAPMGFAQVVIPDPA